MKLYFLFISFPTVIHIFCLSWNLEEKLLTRQQRQNWSYPYAQLSSTPLRPMAGRIASHIRNFDIRWSLSFTLRPLFPRGRIRLTHLIWDRVRPQSLSGLFGEKRTLSLPGNELRCPCFLALSQVVYWLNCLDSTITFYLRLAYTKYTSTVIYQLYSVKVLAFCHIVESRVCMMKAGNVGNGLPEGLLCLHFTPSKIYTPFDELASNTSFKEEHLVWSYVTPSYMNYIQSLNHMR
jgi:hypothetical protein